MIIETPLYYKATDLQTERCQVDEVVTLADMLNNRPEFKSVECADGELNAVIADEYCDESIGEESGMSM